MEVPLESTTMDDLAHVEEPISVSRVEESNVPPEAVILEQTPIRKCFSPTKTEVATNVKSSQPDNAKVITLRVRDKVVQIRDFRIVLKRLDEAFIRKTLQKGWKGSQVRKRRSSSKNLTVSRGIPGRNGTKSRFSKEFRSLTNGNVGNSPVSQLSWPGSLQSAKPTPEKKSCSVSADSSLTDVQKEIVLRPHNVLLSTATDLPLPPHSGNNNDNISDGTLDDRASRLLQALGLRRRGVEVEITPKSTSPSCSSVELFGKKKVADPSFVPVVQNIVSGTLDKPHLQPKTKKKSDLGANKQGQHVCYSCLKVFNNQAEFNMHRRQHITDKHRCPDCGESMGSYWDLKRHVSGKINAGKLKLDFGVPLKGISTPNLKLPIMLQRKQNQQLQQCPPKILKPQNPPPAQNRRPSVCPPSTVWTDDIVIRPPSHTPTPPQNDSRDDSDALELYPPHFMQSFMEVESPKKHEEPRPLMSSEPNQSQISTSLMTNTTTGQNELDSRKLSGNWNMFVPTSGFSGTEFSMNKDKLRLPSYKLPSITTSLALPTVAVTQSPRFVRGFPTTSTSIPTGALTITTAQSASLFPSLTDTTINYSTGSVSAEEYSTYQDLLEPLGKMKNFALKRKDGSILFTVHELEKHIMTTILSEGRDGSV